MDRTDALKLLADARVGHLATLRPDGLPHVVAVTHALVGNSVVSMIDHKPKTTQHLQRLVNIENNPAVSLLADHYSEDWDALWWVRIDGRAAIHHDGPIWEQASAALVAKYPQYRKMPPQGAAVSASIDSVTWWAASTP